MINLFLDDDPNRAAIAYNRMNPEEQNSTIWCQTAAEAISTIWDYRGQLTTVMLDHDLGGETYVNTKRDDCGMEVVRFLERKSREEPEEFLKLVGSKYIVHSWNLSAGQKMTVRLKELGLDVVHKPFGS